MNNDANTDELTAKVHDLENRCRVLQETVRMQGRFADIAGILSSAFDLPKLASSLLNGVFSATELAAGAFLLPNGNGGSTIIGSHGLDIAGPGIRIINDLASRASLSRDVVTAEYPIHDGVTITDRLPADLPSPIIILAAVACHYEHSVNSVLVFASHRAISIESLSFINALSKNVGLSVNNALSYEKIRRTTEELDSERNRLNAIMYNMVDGLLVTDTDGGIIRANRALLEMFGYGKVNLAGKRVEDAFAPALRELVERGTRAGKREAVSLEVDLPGNRTVKALATPLRQESDAACIGTVMLIRDITTEKEIDRMKTDFLATVSHELRTPLTSILGFTRVIKKKMRDVIIPRLATDDEAVRKATRQVSDNIDIIVSEGVRLTELIDNILDLAKLEAGKFKLRKEPASAETIINRAVTATTSLVDQKDLKLRTDVDAGLPLMHADKDRIVQVVINLIANAVKFTDSGTITCGAARQGDAIVISVRDTGIGIAAADLPLVFEKFKQAGDTLTDKPKGTGLGLPICTEIVEGHGGRIWAESAAGGGSTFSFTVPIAGADALETGGPSDELLSHLREHVLMGARSILDSVYATVERVHADIESEKKSILAGRKRELKNLVLLTESHINYIRSLVERGKLPEAVAKKNILEELRSFKYGNNDYIYVSDLRSVLISHPDPSIHGADYTRVKDIHGTLIVPPLVDVAKRDGEGYHSYFTKRLEAEEPLEKLVYGKFIPAWNWVVATGVYLDDIEKEAMRRKRHEIEHLRRKLKELRIAKTGYVYIFDSSSNMLIHPNPETEGTSFDHIVNEQTGRPLFHELVEASRTAACRHYYKWDKPEDPGNYVYDKIAFVRYFPGFDWYIGSSVYVEELYESSRDQARPAV